MEVFLTALGCRLNEAELQMWADEFSREGMSISRQLDDVDLMVINTCAVTSEAARKSRQTIRKLHRKNPQAKLVVTGCYASLEKQQAEEILGVDLIVSNADKKELPSLAKELVESNSMPFAATEPEESALFVRNKERAFIKIQDGCRYRCTYCIVTVARGDESSRTIDELIDEISRLEKEGVNEIVLTGVHVGGYGSDLGTSLYELVVAILEKTQIPRIRFASVEPWDLPENFFELFRNERLMPHMHLPIQSGSNRILRKMSRRCKSETFLKLVEKAREVIPEFNVTTDIIVGFPGETQEDFELSQQIIGQANFGHVHIFSYSDREGTKAARLPEKIDNETKKKRSQQLHKLAANAKQQNMMSMIGQRQNILWEGKASRTEEGRFRFFGHTENYHKIFLDIDQHIDIANQVIPCEVVDYDAQTQTLVAKAMSELESQNQNKLIVKQL
ncbi:tRNA (N(6)-L-threonylcarbamoyladenosine(37)-C(2))-methylthiotransferase MtaB [Aliikangiella coralliicola]|uniref:tRNA (N(6)-L-threonylcarbamoyladenosine(37)-C(2))-methylthiotransferase MtaB n=1 Tax=Aliikangiella coralliicola TaxID=2592383 RepID=A0A545TSU9_9GAMM|nr:tRNA (N(6)-L-threonylcarbamoyladenosine(37)-C(2))-methylthiotransferase MtaB [Aliikangiella coralliicola]TQV80294.1 tRNA (N(6)-L-threonylcarbamoyladenosine(37)-C(2))-methylthiotransferase MtaB [Aliikangiella coralliicola]